MSKPTRLYLILNEKDNEWHFAISNSHHDLKKACFRTVSATTICGKEIMDFVATGMHSGFNFDIVSFTTMKEIDVKKYYSLNTILKNSIEKPMEQLTLLNDFPIWVQEL
jgi:hypothetical protein